jgi:hypothetical protein
MAASSSGPTTARRNRTARHKRGAVSAIQPPGVSQEASRESADILEGAVTERPIAASVTCPTWREHPCAALDDGPEAAAARPRLVHRAPGFAVLAVNVIHRFVESSKAQAAGLTVNGSTAVQNWAIPVVYVVVHDA